MKKLILAATVLAPLAMTAPAFAQGASDAAGFIETPAVTTYAPNQLQLREFQLRRGPAQDAVGVTRAERNQIMREAVPSSAFPTNN